MTDSEKCCPVFDPTTYEDKDYIMLSCDPSSWKSELYINVTKEVPGAENVTFSGEYLTKVYEGHFKEMGKFKSPLYIDCLLWNVKFV